LTKSSGKWFNADNTGYGLAAEDAPSSRVDALRELARVLRQGGRMLVTVPLGEPGDHGWFRLDDVPGWTRVFSSAGLFVEEQEAYELTDEGWHVSPGFQATGVGYGDRGPAASAVLCTELSGGNELVCRTASCNGSGACVPCDTGRPNCRRGLRLTDEQREIQSLAREFAASRSHRMRLTGTAAPVPAGGLREAR
jgi:hypothetical protein